MLQVFASPSRYAQGPGATESLGAEMRGLGLQGPVSILAGASTRRRLASFVGRLLRRSGLPARRAHVRRAVLPPRD